MTWKPPKKAKRDANEPEIIASLEAHGMSVSRLDTPVDLLVGYGGFTWAVEVKMPSGVFTKAQIEFYDTWNGNRTILRSVSDAMKFARECRKK